MKKTLIALLTAVSCAVGAQETLTTPNLVNMWDWQGASYPDPSIFNLCCSGGPGPAINTSTNTIRFSWGQSTVAQAWAINNILSGQGIKVSGFTYSWWIDNSGEQTGTLSAAVNFYKAGKTVESYYYNYGYNSGLTQYSGTETFNSPYSLASLDSVQLSFTGKDDRFWAGYYGPRVRDASLSLTYTASSPPTTSPTTTTTSTAVATPATAQDPIVETTTVTTATAMETVVTAVVAPTATAATTSTTSTVSGTIPTVNNPVRSPVPSATVASVLKANAAQQAALQQTNLDNSIQQSQAQSQISTTTDTTGGTLSLMSFATRGPTMDAASMDPANPTSTRSLAAMMSSANRIRDDSSERDSTARSVAQQSSSASAVGVELGTGVSMSALATVPQGYDRYQLQLIAQIPFYAPKEIYRNQQPVDNDRVRRGLSSRSDVLHQQMVDQQYAR